MNKPQKLAAKYCANWKEGICSGIDFKADGTLFRFRNEGSDCVLKTCQRCSYFESAVLPMRKREWKNPTEARQFDEGIDHYFRLHIPGLKRGRRTRV
jgi:hypothetical protein